MAKFVRYLISARQQTLAALLLGIVLFAMIMAAIAGLMRQQVHLAMARESLEVLRPYKELADRIGSTFAALRGITAEPCSEDFNRQLKRVAYLPDGLNEFFYAPGGMVLCSVSTRNFDPPMALGVPDVPGGEASPAIWVDRSLSFVGLGDLVGSIVHVDPYAIVVPHEPVRMSPPAWMKMEVVMIGTSGRWWHRGGSTAVHAPSGDGSVASSTATELLQRTCLEGQRLCVVTAVSLPALLGQFKLAVAASLVFAMVLATWLSARARAAIVRRWSLESRFRRHLDARSIICAYQPILDLRTGRIAGCEVLARWRDLDDSVVFPDRFIPLVERYGMTRKFTRMVVEKACGELCETLPNQGKLNVTFNIFPRDLDVEVLGPIFQVFSPVRCRFDLTVELVESDAIAATAAQHQIEALRAIGIRTYIDDFGTGYSNIHNLGALAVDGVKLDRGFAMAPEGSLMDRMFGHAIDMVQSSGRVMVVEGVETAQRLQQLQAMRPPIDFAQGYFISRPLSISAFAAFLAEHAEGFGGLDLAA
jgi:sensor c-di-GMP phosphodiesterase-like protein